MAERPASRPVIDFRDLVTDAAVGIAQVGRDGRYVYANHRWCDLLGYRPEEIPTLTMADVTHPEDREETRLRFEGLLASREAFAMEKRFVRKDGSHFWAAGNVSPVIDASGSVRAAVSVITDISARLNNERRAGFLNRLSAQLATVSGADAIIRLTVAALGRELDAHRCYFIESLQRDNCVVVSENWIRDDFPSIQGVHRLSDFGDDQWWDRYRAGDLCVDDVRTDPLTRAGAAAYDALGVRSYAVQSLKQAGDWTVTIGVTDVEPRKWNANDLLLLDDVISRVWPMVERARTEQALRVQHTRREILGDAATVLLTSNDPDQMVRDLFELLAGHFVLDAAFNFLVNEAGDALRLQYCFGCDDDTARKLARVEFGEPVCGLVAVLRDQVEVADIQRSDMSVLQTLRDAGFRAYVSNPLLADGKFLGTLAFATRSRDRFEADELEFFRTVARYVTVAYERLRLIRELRQSDRKKDDFIALLAHELRNPLAPLRSGLQVLRLAADDAQVVADTRAMMDRQLGHMVRLVEDLLDVSRLTLNHMELRLERVLLSDVISNAVETVRPSVERGGHHFTVALPAEPVFLDADMTRLAQVFSNLLTNSAKYTGFGGRITLTAECVGDALRVSVADTGIGIPPESLPQVFDMFSQVDRNTSRSREGLGIGLALVKGLVELHGGSVAVSSPGQGKGSCFTVTLPSAAGDVDQYPRPPAAPESDAGMRYRILVVDDNRDVALSMQMMLRLLGHEVQTAFDGAEAVAAARSFDPQVVFMDVGMPRLDGYQATQMIRGLPRGADIRIVALTGWGNESDRQQSRQAGCDHHLVKPVSLPELEQLLSAMDLPSFPA